MNKIKTKGRLVYDPVRHGFKKTHKTRTLIVELPRDGLDLLYQWFIMKEFGQCMSLQRPMYGTHVTIVGGNENVPKLDMWKKHEGKVIELEYSPAVRNHWAFWSLPVFGDHLQDLRFELGMVAEKDFHITIGRQFDWQQIQPKARRPAWQIQDEMNGLGSF
jgi:hypothetical protein